MMSARSIVLLLAFLAAVSAFTAAPHANSCATVTTTRSTASAPLSLFRKPSDDEDFSDIETRDMTREEMLQLNKKNEDIMNAELIGMTLFSLVLSLPMLYLVYVGFFSETAGINLD